MVEEHKEGRREELRDICDSERIENAQAFWNQYLDGFKYSVTDYSLNTHHCIIAEDPSFSVGQFHQAYDLNTRGILNLMPIEENFDFEIDQGESGILQPRSTDITVFKEPCAKNLSEYDELENQNPNLVSSSYTQDSKEQQLHKEKLFNDAVRSISLSKKELKKYLTPKSKEFHLVDTTDSEHDPNSLSA